MSKQIIDWLSGLKVIDEGENSTWVKSKSEQTNTGNLHSAHTKSRKYLKISRKQTKKTLKKNF